MSARDAQVQLNDLEEEEARIMRELRDLDEKAQAETEAKRRRQESLKEDPETALSQLLLECDKEVRDAKGYIADNGPPLKIVRVRHGETAPKGATFLSRPKGTGVDFTVPVTLKAYNDIVKKPIFLNQMRDKMKTKVYTSSEDYLEDMRLLARNTAAFNKGSELSWVVQHARFLLEAAEDAVTARRRYFYDVEDALRQHSINRQKQTGSLSAVGKRKRSSPGAALEAINGDSKGLPNPGAAIEVYWPNYRKWFAASIQARQGSNVHVIYEEDATDQWVNLEHGLKWRIKSARGAASAKSKRAHEPPASKKRKGGASSVQHDTAPVVVTGGLSLDDLDAVRSDVRSMLDQMRDSVTGEMTRHVEKMDRTMHRSDHLQRVLLAVDDTRSDMLRFMEKVDAKCTRMEELLLQLAGTNIKSIGKDAEKTDAQDMQENPLQKEANQGHVVDTPVKAQPPKGAAVDEVIEIDDASTDKADDVQAVKAEQAETSKVVEKAILPERKEDDPSALVKDVEMADSTSPPAKERTSIGETSAKDIQERKVQASAAQQESTERAAEAPSGAIAPEQGTDGSVRNGEAGGMRGDEVPENDNKPETSAKPQESEVTADALGVESEPTSEKRSEDVNAVRQTGKAVSEEHDAKNVASGGERPSQSDGASVKENTKVISAESTQAVVHAEGKPTAEKQAGEAGRLAKRQEDDESSDGSEGSDDSDGYESGSSSDGEEPEKNAKQLKEGKARVGDTAEKKPLAAVERKLVPDKQDSGVSEEKTLGETGVQMAELRKQANPRDSEEKVIEASVGGGRSGGGEVAGKDANGDKEKEEKSDSVGSDMDVEPAT